MNKLKQFFWFAILTAILGLFACADDSDDDPIIIVSPKSLNQAAYVAGTTNYEFGVGNTILNIKITNAPADTDRSRWAMLHDGTAFRLYFFKRGTNDTIYQFVYNASTVAYEWGFNNAIPELKITGAPADADPSSFAMLHDGSTYRLYMRGAVNQQTLYQFGFNSVTSDYEYGFNSIPDINITGAPTDTDWNRWAMLHDGATYRFYAFKSGVDDTFYQFGFDGFTYDYGFNSIPTLTLTNLQATSDTGSFAMLHDGSNYRFYHQIK